jgi:hypothetical protein
MDPRVLALHDEALLLRPDDASHDGSLCPICVDWSLDESGVPSCFDRLDEARKQAPFGDVEYADPGYLEDGVKRYPLDTEAHIQAAAQFLAGEDQADRYSSDELKQMRQRTQSAARQIGAESQEAASNKEFEEGGSTPVSDTIAQETHEALLTKAVEDATKEAKAEIAQLCSQVEELTTEKDTAQARVTELETANEQANAELDQAQVQLRAVQEEADQLKDDIAQRDEEAQIIELADARAEQVRNLGLFPEDYIKDKARNWAAIPEDDWADRVEEWKQAKGDGTPSSEQLPGDQASAMSGSSEGQPTIKVSTRRAVLGLD